MKKGYIITFVFVLLLFPLLLSAQTTRTVLMERFTGTWCEWCPYGADEVNTLLANNSTVREIAYHRSDPMEINDGAVVIQHLMVTGYPTAAVDRILWTVGTSTMFSLSRGVWANAVANRIAVNSPLSIGVSGTYHLDTRYMTANVTLNIVQDMPGEYYVNVVLVESGLNHRQKKNVGGTPIYIDPYYHNRVVREMLTGPFGQTLTTTGLTNGQTINESFYFTLPSSWDHSQTAIAVFVTKKVMLNVNSTPTPFNMAIQQAYVQLFSNAFLFTPVELTSFSALQNGANVQLLWRTATENSNQGWYVQRRQLEDEQLKPEDDWLNIGFVDGYGTTTQSQSYDYSDDGVHPGTMYEYRLRQMDFDGSVDYSDIARVLVAPMPTTTQLHQNYPNPFNPSTSITVELENDEHVTLEIFDALGRRISTLASGVYSAGGHVFNWNGVDERNVAVESGVYFYRLTTPSFSRTRQMQMTK